MNADVLHQDMFLYNVYSEYLNKVQFYSINSNIQSLSVRYYRMNVPQSIGVERDLHMMLVDQYSMTFDIFDFTPILELSPISYSTENNEDTNQGLWHHATGSMTIMAVQQPIPGDIFHFYQHGSTIEYFDVTTVTYIQSVRDINIYQVEFETANVTPSTVDSLRINRHFYFLREFQNFFDSSLYDVYANLLNNRNDILNSINGYYDQIKCRYSEVGLSDTQITKVNSALMYLNKLVKLKIKVIIGYSIINSFDNYIPLIDTDLYIGEPNFTLTFATDTGFDPTVGYNPYAGLPTSALMKLVFDLQNIYLQFVNYTPPNIDGIGDAGTMASPDALSLVNNIQGDGRVY